jgi:hypothetical protein
MKVSGSAPEDDLLRIAGELLARWERPRLPEQIPANSCPDSGRDCLPCLLEDWDADIDD